jgi:hypothetical protein
MSNFSKAFPELFLVTCLIVVSSSAQQRSMPKPRSTTVINRSGIPSTFFGMHIMDPFSTYPSWPSVPVGVLGKGARIVWSFSEPSRGVYDWSRMDAYVNLAVVHGVKMTYCPVAVPEWAVSDKGTCVVPFAGAPAECSGMVNNIQDWDDFTSALVTRYKGKIDAYELWNEPDTSAFTGTMADMVKLTQHFHDVVRTLDHNALVLSPSYTVSTNLDAYFSTGGTKDIDAITFHAYPDAHGDPELLTRSWISSVRSVMAKYDLASKPLWNTEASWGSGVSGQNLQAAFIARYFILDWSRGVKRTYWYAWDNFTLGTLYDPKGRNPSLPAIAYQQVYNWLLGATITGPYKGQCSSSGGYSSTPGLAPYNFDYNYVPSFYTCNFVSAAGSQRQIVWQTSPDSTQVFVYGAPSQFSKYIDIRGRTTAIPRNRQVTVTYSPIMFVP